MDATNQKHRFPLYLKPSHYAELRELADSEGRSVADLVRQIVAEFLRDREESDRIRNNRRTER